MEYLARLHTHTPSHRKYVSKCATQDQKLRKHTMLPPSYTSPKTSRRRRTRGKGALSGDERVGRHPVGALRKVHPHRLSLRAGDPLVDLSGSRKKLLEHRALRRQAGQFGYVLRQTHATVGGAHAEAVLAAEEALGGGGHQVEHLLRVDRGVQVVGQAVDAVGKGDLETVGVAARCEIV